MQISAANLLASQQLVQRVPAKPVAQEFAPIAFKQAPKPASVPEPAMTETKAPAAVAPGSGPVRPGTHLDIKI